MRFSLEKVSIIIILLLTFSLSNQNITKNKTQIENIVFSNENHEKNTIFPREIQEPILICSNEDLQNHSSQGDGTRADPYILDGYRIQSVFTTAAIEVRNTTAHFIIRNCQFLVDYLGISLIGVAPSTSQIVNNSIISLINDGYGINIEDVHNSTIDKNHCRGFSVGLKIDIGTFCTIRNNTIINSLYQGIQLSKSKYNKIAHNTIQNSTQHGLALIKNSKYNRIHHNSFIDNSKTQSFNIGQTYSGDTSSQGYDDGSYNRWFDDDSKEGNYWSDHSGRRGYQIDGSAEEIDQYPLKSTGQKVSVPMITGIALFSLVVGIYYLKRKRK